MAVADCTRECRYCGNSFVRASKGEPTKYCNHDCRRAEVRRRDREYCKKPRDTSRLPMCSAHGCDTRSVSKGLCFKHYFRDRANGSMSLRCGWCGELKASDGRGYCAGCAMAARRATASKRNADRRSKVSSGDRIDPIRVFERDGWRCHLCGRATPKRLRGTARPRAPELDHIVTLADGGTHTWGNVACACRECNSNKGARSLGQLGLAIAA